MITAENLDIRPASEPDVLQPRPAAATRSPPEFMRLFGIDRPLAHRRLVCHWHRDREGRLASFWEPDMGLLSQR